MTFKFDLENEDLRRSLSETISWCEAQQITSSAKESDEVNRRRDMARQASEMMHTAFQERKKFWNKLLRRKYTNSRLWKEGLALSERADIGSIVPPLREQLRTSVLSPDKPFGQVRNEYEREELVRSVVGRRAELLALKARGADGNAGRFLLYAPDENLFDGAAEVASLGFFDVDNVPPWDTWVAFSHRFLLSWVPPSLVTLVQGGIDVNAEGCIFWMD